MKLVVNPHTIEIKKDLINEKEINITECEFEFSDEITDDFVKEAYFTFNNLTYKKIINNNKCAIPYEVLIKEGQIEIGVVAYLLEDDEYTKRYNPTPAYFNTLNGSLKSKVENTEPITPSEMEQYEQALEAGLSEVANVDIDAEQAISGATITIKNRNAVEKTVDIMNGVDGNDGKDGEDGKDGKDGKDGITPTIGENGNWFLGDVDTGKPSRGATGETGANGQDGTNGQDGEDGYSPTVSTSKSGKVTTIEITDRNGTHTATINDGEDGQNGNDGQNGQDGQDGYSPSASVTQSNNVTTISITDKNGTTTENIDLSTYATSASVGNLSELTTTAKTNLVSAVNEVASSSGGSWDSNLIKLYFYKSSNIMVSTTSLSDKGASWYQKIIDDYFNGIPVGIMLHDYDDDNLVFTFNIFGNNKLRSRPYYFNYNNNSLYRGFITIEFNSSTHAYSKVSISWSKLTTYAVAS